MIIFQVKYACYQLADWLAYRHHSMRFKGIVAIDGDGVGRPTSG